MRLVWTTPVFRASLLFFILFPVLSSAQDLSSAKTFLESAYRTYQNHGKGVDFTGSRAKEFYDSSLISLIRQDQKANGPDVGVLDGDPICSCQDWDGIFDLKIDAHMDATRAIADVSFALFKDGPSRDRRSLQFTLVPENGGWRIWNIVDKSDPKAPDDFRADLVKEIAELTRKKSH